MVKRKTSKPQVTEGGAAERDDALERYGTSAARFRRNLIIAALVALAAVIAVSAGLAYRQYRAAQRASLSNLGSRAVVAAGVVNAAFAGDVAALQTMALSPAFIDQRPSADDGVSRSRPPRERSVVQRRHGMDRFARDRSDQHDKADELGADRRQRPGLLPTCSRNRAAVRQRRPDRALDREAGRRRRRADTQSGRSSVRRPRRQHQALDREHEAECARSRLCGPRDGRSQRQRDPVGTQAGREFCPACSDAANAHGCRHRARPLRPPRRRRCVCARGGACVEHRDRQAEIGGRRRGAPLALSPARLGRCGRARRVRNGGVRRRAVASRSPAAGEPCARMDRPDPRSCSCGDAGGGRACC